jgi:hypothetical protein
MNLMIVKWSFKNWYFFYKFSQNWDGSTLTKPKLTIVLGGGSSIEKGPYKRNYFSRSYAISAFL